MRAPGFWLAALAALAACSGGGSGGGSGDFRLIAFLESGQNNIPRNRQMEFRFSAPVMADQDLSTRLRIQNVVQSPVPNFERARGFYLVNGELVVFTPRLPQLPDRSDAGLAANGEYHVFISGGPDGLQSASGDRIPSQQEFLFETNVYFEDVIPDEPPRALQLLAVDPTDGSSTDISRLDPRPFELSQVDNATLVANGKVIEPGAGGAPDYGTPWRIELRISEPIDPETVGNSSVEMFEIYENAFTAPPDQAPPGRLGDFVAFRVPITVTVFQSVDAQGNYDTRIRVVPIQTLVDNTRYRISFSGDVLGLDYRKTFAGDNGLTGDGETIVDNEIFTEPGGLGYTSEFLVYDRPAITSSRTLEYDPVVDGILPETGQTTLDPENENNSALYNPAQSPGTAVGFLSAFGQGGDGDFAVSGGGTVTIDTGDTYNEPLEEPFQVLDLNPDDDYLGNPLPGEMVEWDSPEYYELELTNFTVSSSATLRVIGVNPIMFRVQGITDITGAIDVKGSAGGPAGGGLGAAGTPGAGGFAGGQSKSGQTTCTSTVTSCTPFSTFLTSCNVNNFPNSLNGSGPGRGYAGGETYNYDYSDDRNNSGTGTGGGGGGHGTPGGDGEDRNNGGAPGTVGTGCSQISGISNSGVIGVRGEGGATYGDREIITVTYGGSGGGAGGAVYAWGGNAKQQSGAGGGGGGGSIAIVSAGPILLTGAIIDASGGDGGKGNIQFGGSSNWYSVAGGGGGGGGGTIALISGAGISTAGAFITAAGGNGGARGDNVAGGCNGCNAGGDGGQGFIFMMDADGVIEGFIPNTPGEYDGDPRGVLTISEFNADRFSTITAVTELFPMSAANPAYLPFNPATDMKGLVAEDQAIHVLVSSAKSNPENPLSPDLLTEQPAFEVALIEFDNGATVVTVTGDMRELNNTVGAPDREAFVRVRAQFEYGDPVQAALGPYANIDTVKISYSFNG